MAAGFGDVATWGDAAPASTKAKGSVSAARLIKCLGKNKGDGAQPLRRGD
jgi:hypothetical protein